MTLNEHALLETVAVPMVTTMFLTPRPANLHSGLTSFCYDESRFILSDNNTAVFSGNVSLENNGGFASTRTKAMRFRLDGFKGILIRVKGDGKKYQFRIRTDDRFDGVSYRYHFETGTGQWQTISVPFDKCVPVFRGRILTNAGPVSPEDIQQVGFLISDKQHGEFQLEIQWMKAYR